MPDIPGREGPDEWHLGVEPGRAAPQALEQREPLPPRPGRLGPSFARTRLDRALFVLTIEHLAWGLIAIWALVTRLAWLGRRPLDSVEAFNAWAGFAASEHGWRVLSSGGGAQSMWVHA